TNGLTASQLANINWQDPYGTGSGLVLGSIIESDGRIRPSSVPELNTVLAFGLLGAAAVWKKRRDIIRIGSKFLSFSV
ncbi:MAG: hypothetical protein JWN25_383, partial [Verrucomicrobiales bacterium]|nr:hypothetical protein [Verrucomicrobiales bacterium]